MRVLPMASAMIAGGSLLFAAPVQATEINFEGIEPGTVVSELDKNDGVKGNPGGPIKVRAVNPADLLPGFNAAVIFDTDNPTGEDDDLGTPNETFGGPGIGTDGEAGQPFENDTRLGNVLIIAEDLVDTSPADGLIDDPDDADALNMFVEFDFSMTEKNGNGTVTITEVTLLDVEADEGPFGNFIVLSGPAIPDSSIAITPAGNNGKLELTGINADGVQIMRFNFNGSGAIASIVFDTRSPGSCWITTGGFQNAGVKSGGKDFTFGGNVGPPPSGSWEVIDHNTGDNFHSNDVHIVDCLVIDLTGPEQPGGKKGFEVNEAHFAGTGRLNGVPGYPFTGFVRDAGEPAGKQGLDKDYYEIEVRDPDTDVVVFFASGELDGGNVQIHPPVGNQR